MVVLLINEERMHIYKRCANIIIYKELPISCIKQAIDGMDTGLPYGNTNEPDTRILL
jgi:hypothetical protein